MLPEMAVPSSDQCSSRLTWPLKNELVQKTTMRGQKRASSIKMFESKEKICIVGLVVNIKINTKR